MAKGTRTCKICGKEYEYCHTQRHDNPFRWQDVACCPEHAAEYFELIENIRNPKPVKVEPVKIEAVEDNSKQNKKKKTKQVQVEDTPTEM